MFSRLIVSVILAVACAGSTAAQSGGLTDDSGRYQIILVGDDAGVIKSLFRESDELMRWAGKCAIHQYDLDNKLYRARYARSMPPGSRPPVLLFTRPDSGVLYCVTADTLPLTGKQLYDELTEAHSLARERLPLDDARQTDDRQSGPPSMIASGNRIRDTVDKMPAIRSAESRLLQQIRDVDPQSPLVIAAAVFAAVIAANLLFAPRPKS